MGKNTLWLPGTDHASIATEAKVVSRLKEMGIEKSSISRDEFLKHAWEWKEQHGGIILEQLKKLGASCDWERTRFTMDEPLYESVIDVFIDFYHKGLIYRGVRMVNWDPKALTALSDEEVIYREVQSKLYYIRYKIADEDNWITIATTRPETILGDTAVCVNPEDPRFRHFLGKKVLVPLINRPIPVIEDSYVDMEFGTGCLKITPAHDINDYELGIRHKLNVIDIFEDNGTLNSNAEIFIGEDRFVVREKIIRKLEDEKCLVKTEDYINKVGFSERTDIAIEPKLSKQWFMKMDTLAKPALEAVLNGSIRFYPSKYINTYKQWMENIRDWCISRQLWWGHRIPAFYTPDGQVIVAKSREQALAIASKKTELNHIKLEDLKQDEDVLDTWFSSWLWPISVFDGIRDPDNRNIMYYYPTNDLVTAPEILFFWVARMIMAGIEFQNDIPFRNVYLTGIVRDKLGRKMSKSLGNSPDPLELINKYGADGVRTGMLLTSPAGNDLPFDEALCEQGRNFSNKIWNALRLVRGWISSDDVIQPDYASASVKWFESRLNSTISLLNDHFSKYRISDALMSVYKLIWDDFCSWYLEMIKPPFEKPIDKNTYGKTIEFFEQLMKLLHPFMPFVTEEIWHLLKERKSGESIMVSDLPRAGSIDNQLLDTFAVEMEVINRIRNIRRENNIPQKEPIELIIKKNNNQLPNQSFDSVISKICNLNNLLYTDNKISNAISFIVKSTEFYIPVKGLINSAEEIRKLEEELEYTRGFLKTVIQKLDNNRFITTAPSHIIEKEKKKKSDAESKIHVLMEKIQFVKNKSQEV
jgi:valyl-tRNA synthetase